MTENELASIVINTAIAIHRKLGPGLFESVIKNDLVMNYEQRTILK